MQTSPTPLRIWFLYYYTIKTKPSQKNNQAIQDKLKEALMDYGIKR